ncbi:MAG: hypothetical protein AB1813_25555 [Verrucomicrobiota bacterium]
MLDAEKQSGFVSGNKLHVRRLSVFIEPHHHQLAVLAHWVDTRMPRGGDNSHPIERRDDLS